MKRVAAALVLCACCAACSSDDDGGADQPAPGTATLSFAVTNGVKVNPNLVDPLKGDIYGALYLAADVTLVGPKEGAADKGSVELTNVDLTSAAQSAETWKSAPLPPAEYMFLGFMDLDGNGATTREPEAGDPVTLPINKFTIEAGKNVDVAVQFDLVLD
ncbi:MAG: hypothetical protein HS104_04435 [Polyangiaceae bacterium]|nr:hypothetical protein [Polyangiaceae bacterium]MCL4753452.1 hypothetical protein [Myxococcales bacterium]